METRFAIKKKVPAFLPGLCMLYFVCFVFVQLQHARLLSKEEIIKSRKKCFWCHTAANIKRNGKEKNIFSATDP
jgi:hypothetical protein